MLRSHAAAWANHASIGMIIGLLCYISQEKKSQKYERPLALCLNSLRDKSLVSYFYFQTCPITTVIWKTPAVLKEQPLNCSFFD